MDIRFLGHAAFTLTEGDAVVLIDPFLTGNPQAAVSADELNPTTILLTHGHADHVGDTVAIAKRTGAPVMATTELAGELAEQGIETIGPNYGGSHTFDWGVAKYFPAWHDSSTPAGKANHPAGIRIEIGGAVVYHAGDTCLFSDLQLVGRGGQVDVAIVPIGGHFTMDRHDAVVAADFIGAKTIIPCHYDTFPAIETDANAFATDIDKTLDATAVVLEPGASHTV
jgi:L-ascorbate metabolism protein UlaG (beta-lactamase superfamily)